MSQYKIGREQHVDVDPTGYRPAVGTLEEARAMVDVPHAPTVGAIEVNEAMAKHFCAMIHDANPSYWDEEFAVATWGSRPVPPAMLLTWCMPLEWTPDAALPVAPLAMQVPLPGTTVINVSQEAEFLSPISVGDRLSMAESVVAVSDEKTTFLGTGHFVTTEMRFSCGVEHVATMTNVLFRFTPAFGEV